MRYFLKLKANQKIDVKSQNKIKFNKKLKEKLRDALCKVSEISNKSIEIGFVTQSERGCRIQLQQSIFRSDMNMIKKRMLEGDEDNITTRGFRVEISEDMYIEQVINNKKSEILDVILDHFDLGNNREMDYKIVYQDGDVYDDDDDEGAKGIDEVVTQMKLQFEASSGDRDTMRGNHNLFRIKSVPVATENSSSIVEEQKLIEMEEIVHNEKDGHTDKGDIDMKAFLSSLQSKMDNLSSLKSKMDKMERNQAMLIKQLMKSGESDKVLEQATLNELDEMLNVDGNMEQQFSTPM